MYLFLLLFSIITCKVDNGLTTYMRYVTQYTEPSYKTILT